MLSENGEKFSKKRKSKLTLDSEDSGYRLVGLRRSLVILVPSIELAEQQIEELYK